MNAIKTLISQYRGLRREIYILFFGRIVTSLGSMVWPMLTMILSRKLGMNAFAISVLTVASMCIMMPANLLGGRLADKYNKKRVIVVCDFVSVGCYVLCAVIPLGYVSVALMIAAGICQSMENPSYDALIADLSTTAGPIRCSTSAATSVWCFRPPLRASSSRTSSGWPFSSAASPSPAPPC